MESASVSFLDGPNGRLAYSRRNAGQPGVGVVWFGGLRSDMTGSKASFLDEWAKHRGRPFLRFDYSGHGRSEGAFEDGAIGAWADDALAVVDAQTAGPQILVGSSMGAWTATLCALSRPERVAGLLFIAPAPDFTETLIWPSLSGAEKERLMEEGRLERVGETGENEVITRALIEDGRRRLVMDEPVPIECPVRILQGMADDVVPWRHALAFAERIVSEDIDIHLSKRGDHRLSTPSDLERLACVLEALCARVE